MKKNYPRYIPIEGTKFVRDMENGAILNTDVNELNNYYHQKKIRDEENREKELMKNKLLSLERDMSDIKRMLSSLLTRE